MSPTAMNIYLSDVESSHSLIDSSESDIEDMKPIKVKTPLCSQYKAAAPYPNPVDIDWIPSRAKYMQRVASRLKEGIKPTVLPQGYPQAVEGRLCWSKSSISSSDVVLNLTVDHIKEIEDALAYFKCLGLSKDMISCKTFPLPSLAAILDCVSNEVHDGRGVAILRGLDPTKYSFADNIILYAGIASYIGEIRGKQDRDGNILVHIKDVGQKVASNDLRQSPYANNAQPFHNDLGDIIGLYCMDKAMVGGVSRLASAAIVYNELAAHRPDLIAELAASAWSFDKNDGSQTYRTRPILFKDSSLNRVFFQFSRRQLTGSTVSPRPAYLPQLTEAQAEALDAVHFTADKHAITIQLEKGDIQFSNNLALFHAREAFQDGADINKRHLVRMWLRNAEKSWATPQELREVWDEIYGESRRTFWYMNPDHERAHVINRYNSCHG